MLDESNINIQSKAREFTQLAKQMKEQKEAMRPKSDLELSLRQSINIESIKNQKANKYGSKNYVPQQKRATSTEN